MLKRPTVAVIGAGFSGVMTALRLLEAPDGPCVRLIERRPRFGLGAAYATTNPDHLLNVRAANMSAYPEHPDHFADWLASQGRAPQAHRFVSRADYGAYLQSLLRRAAESPAAAGRLILEGDEVTALCRDGDGWRLTLALGQTRRADAVVLALGNLPPHPPAGIADAALASARYVADPWAWSIDEAPEAGLVVLLGTGLTMVDVVLSVSARRPDVKFLALSRRGLLPRRHVESGAAHLSAAAPPPSGSARRIMAQVRRDAAGQDWRGAIDALRPHVQSIWRGWSLTERRRFLRHARPWWDVHRHRLAPKVAARLDHLTASGVLRTAAGQIRGWVDGDGCVGLAWTPRGSRTLVRTRASVVVNCTGPNADLAAADDGLIAGLAEAGLIRADACRLGVDVDPHARLVRRDGGVNDTLFAVGPITRGAFWEITSVPDIRHQARDCALAVQRSLTRTPA
jgi:uncharacterized NAD(P)/FAD-binding protein YdhS